MDANTKDVVLALLRATAGAPPSENNNENEAEGEEGVLKPPEARGGRRGSLHKLQGAVKSILKSNRVLNAFKSSSARSSSSEEAAAKKTHVSRHTGLQALRLVDVELFLRSPNEGSRIGGKLGTAGHRLEGHRAYESDPGEREIYMRRRL